MRSFDYSEPTTLDEAVALLARFEGKGQLLAGGTDLFVEIRGHTRAPDHVINLKRIAGLARLGFDPEHGLECGALVTVRELEVSPPVRQHYRGLMQAAQELGSIQVRNRATLVGNVCRASPSAETLPPLLADGASVVIHGRDGARKVAFADFFTGPGRTVLKPDEVLTAVHIPPPPPFTGKAYIKHGRRKAMELATVGVAATVTMAGERIGELRIVLGAVAPTVIRARQAEALLTGKVPSEALLLEAGRAAMDEARPISDVRASADYRRQMVGVLTRRAVAQAIAQVHAGAVAQAKEAAR